MLFQIQTVIVFYGGKCFKIKSDVKISISV